MICLGPPSSYVGELGHENLTSDVLIPHQPVQPRGIQAVEGGRQKRVLGDRLWQASLPPISLRPFNLSIFIPLPLVELSPGAPALFSEAAAHLKKLELETVKAAGPWPALHININKVPRKGTG